MTRYVKGVSIYKPKSRSRKTDPYLLAYTEGRKRRTLTGSTDLRVSIAKANEIGLRLESAKLGLIDANSDRHARAGLRPIAQHVEDYRKALIAQNRTEGHANETATLCLRVFVAGGVERIGDLTESGIQDAIFNLKGERNTGHTTLSLRQRDKAVRAVKAFARWLKRDKRAAAHLLSELEHYDPEQDRRRIRRVVEESAAVGLVTVTRERGRLGNMSGPERAIFYATAIGTGLRFGTLKTITPASIDFDAGIIHVEAKNWKSRKRLEHPIRDDLRDMLREWTAGKPADAPIFTPARRFNETFQKDCRAAGIPAKDASGHVFDFHAQRNQYITEVVRAAGIAVAQDLAHHSTPVLTKRYARLSFDDYGKALDALPRLTKGQEKQKKSGGAA